MRRGQARWCRWRRLALLPMVVLGAMAEVGNNNGSLFFCPYMYWTIISASIGVVQDGCVRDIPAEERVRITLEDPHGGQSWVELEIDERGFDVVGSGIVM